MRGRRVRLVRPGVGQNWHTVVETGPARGATYILNQNDFTRCNRDGKTWSLGGAPARRRPTIYEVLREKIGREPTNAELNVEVKRILHEAYVERASRGKLRHQRRR